MKIINILLEKREKINNEYNLRYENADDYDYICSDVLYVAEKVIDIDNKIMKNMLYYITELQNASADLISQIEIGNYEESNGHDLKMNDAFFNLKGILLNE